MTLEILICTIDDGISNVGKVLMKPTQDISYLISWEQSSGKAVVAIPEDLKRTDVKIVALQGSGLSRNRNNALKYATGDICLIADDDLRYEPQKVINILSVFEEHPTLDLATFKYITHTHVKSYPSYPFDLRHRPHNYFPCSFETAFRRTSVQNKVSFNEAFGLGAPELCSGEDEIFILDALNCGLNCKFFPIDIVTHEKETTFLTRATEPGVIKARGVLLRIYYPATFMLHYLVAAKRLSCDYNISFFKAFNYMLQGYKYAKKNKLFKYDINNIE